MESVRLGIVGLGNIGKAHIQDHMPRVKRAHVAAVVDVSPDRRRAFEQFPGFESAAAMIASGAVDAVLIGTPHYDHTTTGIQCLQAGLHTLVEKPVSVHKADAEKLLAAYRGDVVFSAMFNQRTDPLYRKIRQLIRSGETGRVLRIQWSITNWFRSNAYYASGGWRATWAGEGGGVLLNQAPHNLDLFQWMFGMPQRVRAFCRLGHYHPIEVEDDVTAYMEYEDGASATFITSTGEFPGTNRLEIATERGRLVAEHGRLTFERTEESVVEFNASTPHSFPSMPLWRCEIPVSGSGGQHAEIIQNFVDAILDGRELIAPAVEGIHSVELANAMILSSLAGETIELPMDGARYEAKLQELIQASRK